jgi:hypothetical protein
MHNVMFRRATLGVAVACALLTPTAVWAADNLSPTYAAAASKFYEEGKLSGGLFYFQRNRQRIDGNGNENPGNPKSGKYESNLSHATSQLALNYNSGYAWDIVGLDVGGFGAYDLAVDEANPVNQENEFSFAGNKWGENYSDGTPDNGASLANASLKLKLGERVTAKGGLTQLYVPGVMGVNWSYQPGTYRGAQIEGNFGGLYLTYAWADEYKSPWFKETQVFSKAKAWMNPFADGNTIDYLHAMAARYTFTDGTSVTGSFGQAKDYMDSYHFKLGHKFEWLGGFNTSYQLYTSNSKDNTYDGTAWQQAFTTGWGTGAYAFRFEGIMTKADGSEGNYLPRLTRGYGNSQGANEIWWDSRSDWNANNEKALFVGITRSLDDLMGAAGWTAGVSGAYGWDIEKGDGGKAANGADTEWAANFDLMYTVQDGKVKGTLFKLHYTDYNNSISQSGGWTDYPNIFASERDVKFHIIMPLTIL